MQGPIDTTNDRFVSMTGGGDLMMVNPPQRMEIIPHDEALRMAAWIVALADIQGDEFEQVLDAVRNT